jgi:nucleotide-binding universal stress UspA family protein
MATTIKKILVPIDFGDDAHPAFEYAVMLARTFGASLDLFHVWKPPALVPMQMLVVPEPGAVPRAADDVARSMAEARLDELAAEARKLGVAHVVRRVGVGDPAHDICDLARSGRFDLVVMGTHGRTGVVHALLGSVAEKVVRRAPCPVLTVRSSEPTEL